METTLSPLLASCIFITLGIWVASRQQLEDRGLLIRLFALGFLLRVAVAIGIYLYLSIQGHESGFFPHPDSPIYRDDWVYDDIGQGLAEGWRTGQSELLSPRHNPGYFYTVGITYFLFGHNPFIARIVNCFFSALTIIYVYLLAKEIWDRKVAKLSASLTLFFPGFLVISAFQWKDTIMTFLVVSGIWYITILKKKISLYRIILLMGIIIYAFLIRKQTGIFLGFLAVLYMLIDLRKIRFKHIAIAVLIFIAVGILFSELREFGFFGLEYFYNFEDTLSSYYGRVPSGDSSAGFVSTALIKFMGGNLLTKVVFLPISVGIMLIYPLPLPHLITYGSKIFVPGMLTWYFFIPFFIYGFIYSLKKKSAESSHLLLAIIYIIFSFLSTGMLASGLVRYRLQMMPFAMILIALGILNFKKWSRFYFLLLFSITIIAMLYGIIKFLGGSAGDILRNLLLLPINRLSILS